MDGITRDLLRVAIAFFLATVCVAGEWPATQGSSIESASQDHGGKGGARGSVPYARVKVAIPANRGMPEIREEPATEEIGPQPTNQPVISTVVSPADIESLDSQTATEVLEHPGKPEPKILAILNGASITDKDVLKELWGSRGRETLEWMIGKAILERELSRLGLEISAAEVEDRLEKHLARLRKAFPNLSRPADLTRSTSGMRLDEYRERTVWGELALRKIMQASLRPSEDQLRIYFAECQADFIQPEKVRISQIFIAPRPDPLNNGIPGPADWATAEKQILEAHSRLRMGDNFAAVARAYGAGGQQSRWVGRGELLRELEDAAFSLRPGSLSGPLKSGMGYHIILTEEKHERTLPRFEDVLPEVQEQYEEKRFVLLAGEFMARLRERALKDGDLVIGDMPEMFPEVKKGQAQTGSGREQLLNEKVTDGETDSQTRPRHARGD